MGIFKRNEIQKESNIASAPKHVKAPSSFSVKKFYLILWEILSMTFFCIYVFYTIFRVPEISFLCDIIIYVLYGYGAMLVLILLTTIGQKSKRKAKLKNFKSAIKFLQYTIQIVSIVLLLVTAISSIFTTGKIDIRALTSAVYSLIVTCVMVFFEVIKIMIRKNIPVVKENFLRLKEEDTIYRKLDKGFKKIRGKKSNEPTTNLDYNQNSDNENNNQPTKCQDLDTESSQNVSDTNSINQLIVQTKKQNSPKLSAELFEQESPSDEEIEANLSKNQRYNKEAGVVIEYDEDDYDSENEEDYEDYYNENLNSKKEKYYKNRFGFFRNFKKK